MAGRHQNGGNDSDTLCSTRRDLTCFDGVRGGWNTKGEGALALPWLFRCCPLTPNPLCRFLENAGGEGELIGQGEVSRGGAGDAAPAAPDASPIPPNPPNPPPPNANAEALLLLARKSSPAALRPDRSSPPPPAASPKLPRLAARLSEATLLPSADALVLEAALLRSPAGNTSARPATGGLRVEDRVVLGALGEAWLLLPPDRATSPECADASAEARCDALCACCVQA